MPGAEPVELQVAIIGGGTMGGGLAHVVALAGIRVTLTDSDRDRSRRLAEGSIEAAERFEAAALLQPGSAKMIAEHVVPADDLATAVADARLVIEAVTEDPTVKRDVYAQVEDAAPSDALLATNTSAIPIGDLARGLRYPERFLGTHWFNPPQWVPAVEVIPGSSTDPMQVERACALLRRLGKHPVVVGDSAGFVANRIQFAMFKEAVSVVADGVATAEQVDEIVRGSFGFRLPFYGPFAIADMAGLDVYAGAYAALEEAFGSRFSIPAALAQLVDAGRLGTKRDGGFLGISGAAAETMVARRDARYQALSRLLAEVDQTQGS